jgi:hypothetical protein
MNRMGHHRSKSTLTCSVNRKALSGGKAAYLSFRLSFDRSILDVQVFLDGLLDVARLLSAS